MQQRTAEHIVDVPAVRETEKPRDEDEVNKVRIEAKDCSENYCVTGRNAHTEEKRADKLEAGHMEKAVRDSSDQVDMHPSAGKVKFEKLVQGEMLRAGWTGIRW